MKNELKYVPLVGWSFYLLEMPFLKRDFVKDREQLVEGVKLLADFPMPAKVWTVIDVWENEYIQWLLTPYTFKPGFNNI